MQSHYFGCRINPPNPDVWSRLELANPLTNGTGGEGGIFTLKNSGTPERVAKIYNQASKGLLNPEALKALAYLTSMYSQFSATNSMPFVAWPIEVLFLNEKPLPGTHLSALAGITMRRITGHVTLEKLTSNGSGRVGLGNETAVRLATTLAGHLKRMHRNEVIFCDFNPRNVLVSHDRKALVFVDADAFQHKCGTVFTKPHFSPGYASPDQLALKPGPRCAADDNFVLAIHIFQLLTDGGHPFTTGPMYEPPGAPLFGSVTQDDNIKTRRWPYSDVRKYHPPGDTPQLYARLHPELKAMFVRAFQNFAPPTAEEWENLLPRFSSSVEDPAAPKQTPRNGAHGGPTGPTVVVPQFAHRPRSLLTKAHFTAMFMIGVIGWFMRASLRAIRFVPTIARATNAIFTYIGRGLKDVGNSLLELFGAALRAGAAVGAMALAFAIIAKLAGTSDPAPPIQPTLASTTPATVPKPEILPWKATPALTAPEPPDEVLPWKKPKKSSATSPNQEPTTPELTPEQIRERALRLERERKAAQLAKPLPSGTPAGWSQKGSRREYRLREGGTPVFSITDTSGQR